MLDFLWGPSADHSAKTDGAEKERFLEIVNLSAILGIEMSTMAIDLVSGSATSVAA